MKQCVNTILLGVFFVGGQAMADPIFDGNVPYLMDGAGTEANPSLYVIGENGAYHVDFGSSGIAVGLNNSWNDLLVRNGSTLSVDEGMWMGMNYGSNHNTATVDASTLRANSMEIGQSGNNNSLFIRNGGAVQVVAGNLRLGTFEDSMNPVPAGGDGNQLVVSGRGASVAVVGAIDVGVYGSNNLLIVEQGGRAEAGFGLVVGGAHQQMMPTGNSNRVLVTGADSVLEVNGDAGVAIGATLGSGNALHVADGGTVNIESGISIGNFAGTNNQLVVSGAGSTLGAEELYLGGRSYSSMGGESPLSSAELRIEEGGTVQIRESVWIGSYFGGDNQVLVSGRNSIFQVGENLWLDTAQSGMPDGLTVLTVADAGIVKVEGDLLFDAGMGENGYIRLHGGYFAWAGDNMDGLMHLLLNGAIQVWNPETGMWENALGSAYFVSGYFDSDEAAAAFSGYDGLGGYTILTSMVPEPATYALMLGGVVVSLLLLRRRSR